MNTSTATTAPGSAPATRQGGPALVAVLLDLFGRLDAKDLETRTRSDRGSGSCGSKSADKEGRR